MITKKREDRPVRATGTAQSIKRQVQAVLICSALALFALLLTSSFAPRVAMATPPSPGISRTPIASGVLAEPVRAKFKQGEGEGGFGDGTDVSNLTIVKLIVQPGSYLGWHQHSGPTWIIVTQGTLTFYDGDDPTCTGHPVSAGSAYFDPGNHTLNAKNETNAPVEQYVMLMLPAGGAARIDEPNPGVCPQLP